MKYQYQGSNYLRNKFRKLIDKYYLGKALKSNVKCGCNMSHSMVNIVKYDTVNIQTGEVNVRTDTLNTFACDNTFACPVCSAKILNKAERKITRIILGMEKLNYRPLMFTLVVPHHIDMSANEVFELLKHTRKKLTAYTRFRKMLQSMGSRYSITSTECTYGKNGFHFHQHILYFLNVDKFSEDILLQNMEKINKFLMKTIAKFHGTYYSTAKEPLYYSKDKDGHPNFTTSGAYITASLELTSNNHKKCRSEQSRQMLELLDSDDETDNLRYLDYALATRQKQRIQFSRNIYKFMVDEDDEELKKTQTTVISDTEVVASFTADSWNEIFHKYKEADILQAAVYGYDTILEYCKYNNLPLPLLPIGQLIHKMYNSLETTILTPISLKELTQEKNMYGTA